MKNKFDFQPKLVSALKNYSKEKFMTDLMAGIIVGIVALPLAIAFGIASGVSPEKGLITAIIGGFIVSLLGGNNVQIGGPTGAFIVIVYGIIQNFGIEGLAIATVVAGIILVIMGALKLGTVIKFIPYPIVVGFTSGIALTIFTTQMKDLFGLTMDKVPADFISKWIAYFEHFDTVNLWSLLIGLASIVIIAVTPKFFEENPRFADRYYPDDSRCLHHALSFRDHGDRDNRRPFPHQRLPARTGSYQLQYGDDQPLASFRLYYRDVRSDRIVAVRHRGRWRDGRQA